MKTTPQSPTRRRALKQFDHRLAGLALAFLITLGSAKAAGPTFTAFDYPGAMFADGVGINRFGDIVGHYIDTVGLDHGYLLHKGSFSTVDFPGSKGCHAHAISSEGVIVGLYFTGKRFHDTSRAAMESDSESGHLSYALFVDEPTMNVGRSRSGRRE